MKFIHRTLSFLLFVCISANAQNRNEIKVETLKLTDQVYMLIGQGGNVGIYASENGLIMVDDQYPHMTPKLMEAIKSISDKPIKFLLNTHWHGDHSGGNENFNKGDVVLVAHENVRKRMSTEQFNKEFNRKTPASPEAALPEVTFTDDITFHMDGENIMVFHVHDAHTDGDAIVYFADNNVLHMGDTYFGKKYPFIDISSGGSVNGVIGAIKKALIVANDDTIIIPGHGGRSNKAELRAYLTMLEEIKANVEARIAEGKSEEEIGKDASITKKYDDKNYGDWFIKSDFMRLTFYRSLSKSK
ncbi:MBL fold metallo-hydrolase [Leptobacterium flavescens]|uniref:MBL fold metallo-hydrolase n=1 Tax=Leptobacterium flavescens TaxID=472055 RepID=A0A6P0UJD7_9FLAO|nr:MBL fold metallo-hydrolase [Leptobacterium flavescens]NER12662.1 MBL fold metallo-hydrolase [Leptobacterium flavescens]